VNRDDNHSWVERFSLTSSQPFDKILAAIKAANGHPDMIEFVKRTAAAAKFPEFESIVREGLGKTDLMLFMELDQGAVIRKAAGRDKPRMVRLILGNPLIMQQMARHVPDAGSYAPVTVAVARDLDKKVETLLSEATVTVPRKQSRKFRRSGDESIAVGSLCQRPDSRGHEQPCARRDRDEMVAYFFDTYFRRTRCGAGGHADHARPKPETCRLDRGERQEFDDDLRDP
jgi:uncharacterized protein (DUF302 family)